MGITKQIYTSREMHILQITVRLIHDLNQFVCQICLTCIILKHLSACSHTQEQFCRQKILYELLH